MMSIIYQTDLEVIDGSRELYKNPIYFFSEFEKKRLLAVYELFEDSIDAFKNQDIEKARDLMGHYKENISSQCDSITNDIILGKIDDLDARNSTAVGLYARYLKRVSAHSRNLISSIVNPFERIGYPE